MVIEVHVLTLTTSFPSVSVSSLFCSIKAEGLMLWVWRGSAAENNVADGSRSLQKTRADGHSNVRSSLQTEENGQ